MYTDPPVASVGRADGRDSLVSASVDLSDLARTQAEEGTGGLLVVTADRDRRVVIGASAIGARADDWMAEAALAVRAQVPLSVLVDTVHAFPSMSEALGTVYRELPRQVPGRLTPGAPTGITGRPTGSTLARATVAGARRGRPFTARTVRHDGEAARARSPGGAT